MNAARHSLLALAAILLSTSGTGCAWLLYNPRAQMAKTAPIEIMNMTSATVCSVRIWNDKPRAQLPDHNWLENTVSTPMGIELKVFPLQPGDSRYFRLEAPDTYHAAATPCGGTEVPASDIVLTSGSGVKWVLE